MADAERDHINRKITTLEHAALMRRTIKITCPLCRKVRVIDAVPLWWRWSRKGWKDDLKSVAKRLYCEKCWRGRFSSVRPIVEVSDEKPDNGPQGQYPDQREWKRLVSRYRS